MSAILHLPESANLAFSPAKMRNEEETTLIESCERILQTEVGVAGMET